MTEDQSDPTDSESIGRGVRRGAFWLGANSIMIRFSNIAVMVVIARIVAPREFGIFTLAIVAHATIVTFAELGVASAIARRDLDENKIAPTGVTISVGVNAVLGGLLALFAEPVARLLGSVEAAPSLRILAISVTLTGVFVVPAAQLQRGFRQQVIFRANLIGTLLSSALLIGLAFVIDGAQAFAWSRVVGQLITGAIMVAALGKRYRPGWNVESVRLLLRFGVPLALANLLSQVVANIDYVFVGRFLSLRDVGLYTLAFNVASWASSVLGSVLNGVVLPAFSAVRRGGGDLSGALFTAVRVVSLISFPIAAMTGGLAGPLVVAVYGDRWADAAPVIVILSIFGAATAIAQLIANVLIASGRTTVLLFVQIGILVALVPALWFSIRSAGLVGAGIAHVATALLITIPIYVRSLRRSMGPVVGTIVRAAAWPLGAAIIAGVCAHGAASLLTEPWWRLLLGGTAGGIVYLLLTARQLLVLVPVASRTRFQRWWPTGSGRSASVQSADTDLSPDAREQGRTR